MPPLAVPVTTPRTIPDASRLSRRHSHAFSSVSAEDLDNAWLDMTARELSAEERDESGWIEISGDVGVEQAVEVGRGR